eukprot:3721642-Rhodomonas_salina.1
MYPVIAYLTVFFYNFFLSSVFSAVQAWYIFVTFLVRPPCRASGRECGGGADGGARGESRCWTWGSPRGTATLQPP